MVWFMPVFFTVMHAELPGGSVALHLHQQHPHGGAAGGSAEARSTGHHLAPAEARAGEAEVTDSRVAVAVEAADERRAQAVAILEQLLRAMDVPCDAGHEGSARREHQHRDHAGGRARRRRHRSPVPSGRCAAVPGEQAGEQAGPGPALGGDRPRRASRATRTEALTPAGGGAGADDQRQRSARPGRAPGPASAPRAAARPQDVDERSLITDADGPFEARARAGGTVGELGPRLRGGDARDDGARAPAGIGGRRRGRDREGRG